jgi:hypothetical protein
MRTSVSDNTTKSKLKRDRVTRKLSSYLTFDLPNNVFHFLGMFKVAIVNPATCGFQANKAYGRYSSAFSGSGIRTLSAT